MHVRVGMEDTICRWPHKDDILDSNAKVVAEMVGIAKALGRRPATVKRVSGIGGFTCTPAHPFFLYILLIKARDFL